MNHSDALDTLGTILTGEYPRDAVHLAVLPAKAGHPLLPGHHVRFDAETGEAHRAVPGEAEAVGIVDPFLVAPLETGQAFWLVVYPRTITSLHHVWEHPALPSAPKVEIVQPDPVTPEMRVEAEQWLRENIGDYGLSRDDEDEWGDTFESVIAKAESGDFQAWGGGEIYIHLNGVAGHGAIPSEFWTQLEIYVGHPVSPRATHWSCSC